LPQPPSSSSSCSAAPGPPDVHMNDSIAACPLMQFVHGKSLEVVQSFKFQPHEQVSALTAAIFEGDPCEYLVVGTAHVCRDEPEPLHGRILVYANKVSPTTACKCAYALVSEMDVPGAVYALETFKGALLGTVNNRVIMWRWSSNRLESICGYSGGIIAVYLQVLNDSIMVGDLMRSASILNYVEKDNALVEVARDTSSAWLTSISMLSENLFLCADDAHNIFTLQRGSPAAAGASGSAAAAGTASGGYPPTGLGVHPGGADDSQLERVGQMHMGEFVNRIHRAKLVEHPVAVVDDLAAGGSKNAENDSRFIPLTQVVWASVDGAIGLMASLPSEREFARLSIIQDCIFPDQVQSLVEGLPHGEWRDYWGESQGSLPHKGFIDGNLLESVLEMPKSAQQALVDRLRARNVVMEGVNGLVREIEAYARLH